MKKLVLKSIFFLAIFAFTISCNKDDAPAPAAVVAPPLVGTWEFSKEADMSGNLVNYTHTAGCSKDKLTFNATTVRDYVYEIPSGSTSCVEFGDILGYTRSGNTLTITDGQDVYTATILTLTATELKIKVDTDITVLKRI